MGIIELFLLAFLTAAWIRLGIMLSKWKKEDERKEDLYEKNNNH